VFDTLLAMYVERAADDKMCIYCLGVNIYFSFLFFSYYCHCFLNFSYTRKFEKLESFHLLVRY